MLRIKTGLNTETTDALAGRLPLVKRKKMYGRTDIQAAASSTRAYLAFLVPINHIPIRNAGHKTNPVAFDSVATMPPAAASRTPDILRGNLDNPHMPTAVPRLLSPYLMVRSGNS